MSAHSSSNCSKHAAKVFEIRFPSLAARVKRCEELLIKQGCKHARPPYGFWYNYCINGPQDDVKGVMTRPHVDGKNLAIMMCVVFVWGECEFGVSLASTHAHCK